METTHQHVRTKFTELFKQEPILVRSPGRINLIGEHTDYNDGFVMPAAIDKEVVFAMAGSSSETSKIFSVDFNESVDVDLNDLSKVQKPLWLNYLLGVLKSITSKGHSVSNFNCVVGGNIPVGAGLSSSAAFECGFAFGINELNKLELPKIEMIKMAQWAEHNYAGVKCGIMDQFASMMGREGDVFVLDCRDLSYNYYPFHSDEYELVLIDSCVKHSLASSEYNTRRQECEEGVRLLKKHHPDINSLRDVNVQMMQKHAAMLPEKIRDRCSYVVEENQRVQDASTDLQAGDLKSFGVKMFATHEGLSKLYEVSCVELDFLVDYAKGVQGILGSRLMGGGFGGCTINIVQRSIRQKFIDQICTAYEKKFNIKPLSYTVHISDGTSVVNEYIYR